MSMNTAKSTSFRVTVSYNRDVSMRIQSTNLGSINLNPATMPARYSNIPFPGDKIEFNALNMVLLLDEDISEWVLLNKWMFELSQGSFTGSEEDITSVEVTLLDRDNQPSVRIVYHNAFPTTVDDIQYSYADEEMNLTCGVTFIYTHYTITNVKTGEEIAYGQQQ